MLHVVSNSIVSRYWQNDGVACRRFPAIREKPEERAFFAPPPLPSSARWTSNCCRTRHHYGYKIASRIPVPFIPSRRRRLPCCRRELALITYQYGPSVWRRSTPGHGCHLGTAVCNDVGTAAGSGINVCVCATHRSGGDSTDPSRSPATGSDRPDSSSWLYTRGLTKSSDDWLCNRRAGATCAYVRLVHGSELNRE